MMSFDQLLAKLRSRHPKVGEVEGKVAIAEAYRDLVAEERWAFLLAEAVIHTEAVMQSGTVAIANGGTLLTLTPDGDPWQTTWTQRRVVIDGSPLPFKVSSFGSTTTATLASPWPEDAVTAATYTMYRSLYAMPSDCDYGRDLLVWDCANNCELPMISMVDMRRLQASRQGQANQPEACSRFEIQQSTDGELNPLEMLEFGPTAPTDVQTFVVFYYRQQSIAAGTAKPVWPENFEDLIWRRAELNLEENPRHRVVLAPTLRQRYHSRLWALKKLNDGGAEIERRIALIGEGAFGRMNVSFTSSGINPLIGG